MKCRSRPVQPLSTRRAAHDLTATRSNLRSLANCTYPPRIELSVQMVGLRRPQSSASDEVRIAMRRLTTFAGSGVTDRPPRARSRAPLLITK
jgi:hypothetical protein